MTQLGLATNDLAPPAITPVFPTVAAAPIPVTSEAPTITPVVWQPQTAPTPLAATLNVDSLLPEPFDAEPPALIFGTAPTAFSDLVPESPGINIQFEYPDLVVNLPAPPSLLTVSTKTFDGVSLPTVDESVPELVAVAPTLVEYNPGASYSSALLTTVQATFIDRITNGGTGLPPEAEAAIWSRGREREAIAYQDALNDLERMERMGFAYPPGVYADARLKVNTEMRARTVSISREIMIKQAELEVQNIQQSLTQAVQLESTLLNYNNQVEQRLFDSSKYATEAGISIYNAKVQAYGAFLDAYKTKIAIYEAKIRGELARVDAYKTEVAAEQLKSDINNARVNQFKILTDAALSNIEIFKAQVGAIQAKADIEKLKIQIFGEQVRAYTAKIGAYTAGVEGFRATVQAEGAKQEAYRSQVQAYAAEVDAIVKIVDARIEEYKGRIAAKNAEWEGYKAAYQGEAARAQAIAANNSSLVEAYRAEIAGDTGYNDVLTKQWQVAVDQAQRTSEIGISAAKANAELYLNTRSLAVDSAKVGAQVSAQIAAASLNAVNYSYNNSVGYSSSNNAGLSASLSTSRNYSYSENVSV
jgi:hypothetical protein